VGEPHLYAVDPDGTATADPGNPDDGPPPPAPPSQGRAPSKARPSYPVPTDRLKFEKQVEALRVVAVASNNGQQPVGADRMGSMMRIANTTAALNNAFFVDVGLLTKAGKGQYLPTDPTLEFQRKYSFDKAAAPQLLRSAFVGTWFHEAVHQRLTISPATKQDLVATIADIAGTDASYATQYGHLLEWLAYVGLLHFNEDGTARLLDSDSSPTSEEAYAEGGDNLEDEQVVEVIEPEEPVVQPQDSQAVVSLTLQVNITADDLTKLEPEQITALFQGVGAVASVKAILAGE
jgi:hypothetical protein